MSALPLLEELVRRSIGEALELPPRPSHSGHGVAGGPLGITVERILRLALITGQRRSEITQALKTEFNLTGADPAWVIPGARTKNGVMHRVPLTPMAVELFSAAVADSKTPFVFPGRGTTDSAIDPHAVTRAMSRLMKDLGIPDATIHDMRRTVGTDLARLGVSKDIRARLLNHVDGARSVTDAVYNQHEFWAEKRAALGLWEAELRRIVA
jgi:integrase